MAVPEDTIPSLSEIQCQICVEILIEPVTLPCNHTLCNTCFQSTIEKANLCCPFCRRRISSWTRYHTRRNSLVNMELWEKIQKYYPKECKLRVSGQKSEGSIDDVQPVRLLSKPGELRREYEEEVKKMEAERRASEEEENSAMRELLHRGRGMKRRSSWSAMCCRAESSSWFSAGWARSWKEGIESQVLSPPICQTDSLSDLFPSCLWRLYKVTHMKFSEQCFL